MSSGLVQIGHSVTSLLPGKTRQSIQNLIRTHFIVLFRSLSFFSTVTDDFFSAIFNFVHCFSPSGFCITSRWALSGQIQSSPRSPLNAKLFDACHKFTVTGRSNKSFENSQSHPHHHNPSSLCRLPRLVLSRMSQESAKSWLPCGPTRKSVDAKSRSAGIARSAIITVPSSAELPTYKSVATTEHPICPRTISTCGSTETTRTPTGPGTRYKGISNPCSTETEWPECRIPQPVFALFIYLAQRGVHVNDLFRRPGNITQMKVSIRMAKHIYIYIYI
ncbi:Unconventional myosin-IXa [Fasciola gigantica]|uniref:Unconventional myosin-IXa n=1 Tax=Fasciola gigantica TaxID=46835 RepID=A0A504YIN1_FASGI|nr:Unconventional myosin-IXa [Fasciola gigantica]